MESASTLSVFLPWKSEKEKWAKSALNTGLEENNPTIDSKDPVGLVIRIAPFTRVIESMSHM